MANENDSRKTFLSKSVKIVKNEKYSDIDAEGTFEDNVNDETIKKVIKLSDEWSRSTYEGTSITEKIDNIQIDELYNKDNWNNKNENSENFGTPQYNYDKDTGVATFTDETLAKVDMFGCEYEGSDTVSLNDLVRDLEIFSRLDRIADFGPIYDFQVRQLSFGAYRYGNAQICANLAQSLGFLSIDKIINDEVARKKRQNELNAQYKGTEDEDKFPPYSGFLVDEEYLKNGWIDIDKLIQASFADEWAYDQNWSLAIRTRKFKDRKRLLVYLMMTYASNIWELNSDNKLVDFGIRILDKTTNTPLDYSASSNGLHGQFGSSFIAHFSGTLEPVEFVTEEDEDGNEVRRIASGQPDNDTLCDKDNICNKVYTDKCTGRHFRYGCKQDLSKDIKFDEELNEEAVSHELMPQFRIDSIEQIRREKPDITNTIDPIHWTTGIDELESFAEDRGFDYSWVDRIKEEFGEEPFQCTYLNQGRAFHFTGGDFTDGFASGGVLHNTESDLFDVWGTSESTESWNGTAWTTLYSTGAPKKAFGISGGTSTFAVQGWGIQPQFLSSRKQSSKTLARDSEPASFSYLTPAFRSLYEFSRTSNWTLVDTDTIVDKHSVAGTIAVKQIIPGGTSENADFNKVRAEQIDEDIEGCVVDNKDLIAYLGADQDDNTESVSIVKTFAGICFNGSKGDVTLDAVDCSDFDDTFILFNEHYANKAGVVDVSGNALDFNSDCSFTDPTLKYPVKTIGTRYVGSSTQGLATGGKTCVPLVTEEINAKSNKYYRYYDDSRFVETNDSVIPFSYEYTGTSWIRRDDMAEDMAYHAGVGDQTHALFFGGLHGTIEEANFRVNFPGCDDWFVLLDTFGGAFNRFGSCGMDREIRYADFATYIDDEDEEFRYLQVGDSTDTDENALKILDAQSWDSGVAQLSANNWTDYVTHRGHIKQIAIPDGSGNIEITYFLNGQTSQAAHTVLDDTSDQDSICAGGEEPHPLAIGSFIDSITAGMLTGTPGVSGYHYAPRTNITLNLESGYESHPTSGGQWIWTRPTKGENLFHPDNFSYTGTDDVLCHSFTPPSPDTCSDKTVHSFYIGDKKEGLDQWWYGLDKDKLYERWSNPFYTQMQAISGVTVIWDGADTAVSDIPDRGTMSVGHFTYKNDAMINLIDDLTATTSTISAAKVDYDIDSFKNWLLDDNDTNDYPIKAWDEFETYFDPGRFIASRDDIVGSCVRDRATLWPWGDLLGGDADNKATEGETTWTWGSDGSLYIAETVMAETVEVTGDLFEDSLGRTIAVSAGYYPNSFWREKFRIRKILPDGNRVWDYTITYDDTEGAPTTPPTITDSVDFSVFGTSLLPITVDKTRWNGKYLPGPTQTWIGDYPDVYSTSSFGWQKEDITIEEEQYNYRRETLCEMLDDNHTLSPDSRGVFSVSTTASNGVWLWSVPYVSDGSETQEDFYIQNSSLVRPISAFEGAEIVHRIQRGSTGIHASRAVLAQSESNGIALLDWGKSTGIETITTIDISGISGISGTITGAPVFKPFDYDVDAQPISNDPPSNDELLTSWPWNVLSEGGLLGPTNMTDMIDDGGNYWLAVGEKYNVTPSDSTNYINNYTIVRVPSSKRTDFEKTVVAHKNATEAQITYDDYYANEDAFGLNNVTGVYYSNDSARNREGVLEALNTAEGQKFFDLYVRIWDYNFENYQTNTFTSSEYNKSLDNSQGLYDLILGTISEDRDVRNIQYFDLVTEKDANCIDCYACLEDTANISGFSPTEWKQHNHEEWVAPTLEHLTSGVFSREGFNAWVSAGDFTRWGSPMWSTVDSGKGWIHYRYSHLLTDEANNNLVLSYLTTSIAIEDFVGDDWTPIPATFNYDEYIFDLEPYTKLSFIQGLLERETYHNQDCGDIVTAYIPDSTFSTGVTGSYNDVNPNLGYTDWATSFIMEYKERELASNGEKESYYYRYDIDNKFSNTQIEPPNIKTENGLVLTDWRRFQDGVGLGGDAPIFNVPDATFECEGLNSYYIGQQAFGTPEKAIICGGYKIEADGEISPSRSWWERLTFAPTFKWNRTVVNPEDTVNKNYRRRTLSPFYTNDEQTLSDTIHGMAIFDVSSPLVVERFGIAEFNDTNEVIVTFEAFPDFAIEKDKYSISLSPSDNVKVWWENKSEESFTIRVELEQWRGTVDWRLIYVDDVPADEVDTIDEEETFDKYEDL